jgi:hypothetical protein
MFVFAIETCGKTVAFTTETDRINLEGTLSGQREKGRGLRDKLVGKQWDGVSPFSARLATDSELADNDCHSACNIDPLSRGIGVQN